MSKEALNDREEMTIEEGFLKLEETLTSMEESEVSLEETFRLYEQGMKLAAYLNERLEGVEQKLQILSEEAK